MAVSPRPSTTQLHKRPTSHGKTTHLRPKMRRAQGQDGGSKELSPASLGGPTGSNKYWSLGLAARSYSANLHSMGLWEMPRMVTLSLLQYRFPWTTEDRKRWCRRDRRCTPGPRVPTATINAAGLEWPLPSGERRVRPDGAARPVCNSKPTGAQQDTTAKGHQTDHTPSQRPAATWRPRCSVGGTRGRWWIDRPYR